MVSSVVEKDGLREVNPVLEMNLIFGFRVLEACLFVFSVDWFDFFLGTTFFFRLFQIVKSSRDNGCTVRDPCNLSSKEVLLLAKEERIGDDVSF